MVGTGLEGVREETGKHGGLPVGLEAPGRTSEGEKAPRSVDREDSTAGLCLEEDGLSTGHNWTGLRRRGGAYC